MHVKNYDEVVVFALQKNHELQPFKLSLFLVQIELIALK